MPHQADALAWASKKDRVAFCHEMRLGKTLTSIWWTEQRKSKIKNILVAAPLCVVFTWQEELAVEGYKSVLLLGDSNQRTLLANTPGVRWFIINYEGLIVPDGKRRAKAADVVTAIDWDCVILDESSRIRNPKAKVSKVAAEHLSRARYKVWLSGLPNPKSPFDFFMPMKFLVGGIMGYDNYWNFRDDAVYPGSAPWENYMRTKYKQELRHELREHVHFLTRKEAGFADRKVFERRYVDLPARVRKAYNSAERDLCIENKETKYTVASRAWLNGLCGGRPKDPDLRTFEHNRKLDLLHELATGDLEGTQFIVWCAGRREARACETTLREAGLVVRRVVGGVPASVRQRYIRSFNEGEVQVLVLNPTAMKYGLNLSNCSTAIYYSLTDDLEDYYQSLERIEHMLKEEGLLYIMLLCRDTIDVDKFEALQQKNLSSKTFRLSVYKRMQERWRRSAA